MPNLLQLLPNVENEELVYIQGLVKNMSDEQVRQFAVIYSSRRKDPQMILLLTLVGFLGVAGIQRFIVDQIGMGLLYVFTGGLCLVGTILIWLIIKILRSNSIRKLRDRLQEW